MDLKGSLVDTHLKIYPSEEFIGFLQTIPVENDVPENIQSFFKTTKSSLSMKKEINDIKEIADNAKLTNVDMEKLKVIREEVNKVKVIKQVNKVKVIKEEVNNVKGNEIDAESLEEPDRVSVTSKDTSVASKDASVTSKEQTKESESTTDVSSQYSFDEIPPEKEGPFLYTSDLVWLYTYLEKSRKQGKEVPYLHELFEGTDVDIPRNSVLKRNPVLEARCVKLRSQQEAREYRKMTKSVDNVRIRFPDDSINYQLKQINRQLIAIGQFIISIFAGFLFGFKGVEWMIGPLDFGFKLLLGVMCALIIALAEIYFLAKKLNEELSVPETVQLGGPPKFVDTKTYGSEPRANKEPAVDSKEHQD